MICSIDDDESISEINKSIDETLSCIIHMFSNQQSYYKLTPEATLSDLQTSFEGLEKNDVATREKIYGKNRKKKKLELMKKLEKK